jgi:Ca2+-binding EF-hand superfamily protein
VLDKDELFNLLLEVQLETEKDEPNIGDIQAKSISIMLAFDTDKSRDLSFLEFAKVVYAHPELLCTACSIRAFFQDADVDSDSVITKSELKGMFQHMIDINGMPAPDSIDAIVDEIFDFCDDNKDGFIDFPEFVKYFIHSSQQGGAATCLPFISVILGAAFANPFDESDIQEYFSKSVYKQLCLEQRNSLGLTDASKPSVVRCVSCLAPLVGSQGIEKFGNPFCNATCLSSFANASQERANYHVKYDRAGFRKVQYSDFGADFDKYSKYRRL